MHRLKIYRKVLLCLFILDLVLLYNMSVKYVSSRIPDKVRLIVNRESNLDFGLPLNASFDEESIGVLSANNKKIDRNKLNISLNNASVLYSTEGEYSADINLFGFLTIKNIDLEVVEEKKVIPGGCQVGIYLETDGLMVLGNGNITGKDGVEYSPSLNIINTGDYILSVDDKEVTCREELISLIQNSKSDIAIKLRRNNEIINVTVKSILCDDDIYRIGLWVRDNMQGIGTLTYIDDKGNFGALGHGINDVDTGLLMESADGSIYSAEVVDIVKSFENDPGELIGVIDNSNALGTIIKNTKFGIFGSQNKTANTDSISEYIEANEYLEIALKQEVKEGKAYIRSKLTGEYDDYEIEISDIKLGSKSNKSFVINVIDERLLEKTNGIVQGMSGSPIIQNEKFVGAVTHVFVNDPTKGYGIFAETMLEQE